MIPKDIIEFPGGSMRPLQLTDVHKAYVEGLNSPEVNRYLVGVKDAKQNIESVAAFISTEAASTNSVLWGIWPLGVEHHVGTVRLHGIEHRHGTAHIGICLFDANYRGKGIGSSAIMAVTNWAIEELGLRWIEAGVYKENIASENAFVSAGYKWVFDINGKYLFEGKPATVRVFSAIRKER